MSKRKSRLQARKEREAAKKRNKQLVIAGAAVAVVAVIAVLLLVQANSSPLADVDLSAIPDESVQFPSAGREHINLGDPHDPYNSNPPTSGPHAQPVRTDVYPHELPDEQLIHNLEHGHIWLSYRDPDDQAALDLFTEIQAQFPRLVVVTHRPGNDARIAVAAWTRLLNLDELDEDQILAFIARYADQAPESIPG